VELVHGSEAFLRGLGRRCGRGQLGDMRHATCDMRHAFDCMTGAGRTSLLTLLVPSERHNGLDRPSKEVRCGLAPSARTHGDGIGCRSSHATHRLGFSFHRKLCSLPVIESVFDPVQERTSGSARGIDSLRHAVHPR
jgi:hypothetical protein